MSLAFNQMMPTMYIWGDFLAKGYSADFDFERDYSALSDSNSIMGSPLSELFWPVIDNWAMTPLSPSYRHVTASTVETLLVSGNIDFSTPFEYAQQQLLPMLENGQQLILTDMGHTGDFWNAQPDASYNLLTRYFDEGVVDDSMFTHSPYSTETGFVRLPVIAKIVVIVLIMVILTLSALAGKLLRRRLMRST
ncbi:MAG: hypothetical protein GXP16_17515 [Gammaproteobacteria bacterium]|nr:hypothetical protein [Gammaproteobacteria bacterium]